MTFAVRTTALSKDYVLGERGYRTLRESLSSNALRPLRRALRQSPPARRQRQVLQALSDLDLEISQGETVGFVGHNGAGKSTLLKVLSRITEPTRGSAAVRGRVGSLLEVGTGFHPELTGRENVFLNGALLGMSRREIQRRFDEIVDFSGVEAFLDTPVKRYSTGMFVRLAFAVAAHLEPEVLIVDEVLSVGDAAFQRRSVARMGEVAREGRTVLFVSHNIAVVQALCSRAVVLENGRKIAEGPTAEAVTQYVRRLEQNASADLLERTDRSGRGYVRVSALRVHGGPSGFPRTGEPLVLEIDVTGVLRAAACAVTVHNALGTPVLTLDSGQASPVDVVRPDSRAFVCTVDELPLVPGRYRLDVSLSGDGYVQDLVPAASYLDVEQGVLGRRPVIGPAGGDVAVAHRWEVPDSTTAGGE
ncbi:MAG: ATP-binding cassette domain-containing protein [Acidimicrobiia bacterium]|nr:ATP-binding cassette domain-containing protein [Acidimicrobiia bacterium]